MPEEKLKHLKTMPEGWKKAFGHWCFFKEEAGIHHTQRASGLPSVEKKVLPDETFQPMNGTFRNAFTWHLKERRSRRESRLKIKTEKVRRSG